eukprot:GHRQ01023333.1.p2 GENE.GHRQ01023333.1~~GHRQ01023333.1.p2  ORF type:complete len:115 (-),score=23.91 GHRQ01023333.1:38-382(-)
MHTVALCKHLPVFIQTLQTGMRSGSNLCRKPQASPFMHMPRSQKAHTVCTAQHSAAQQAHKSMSAAGIHTVCTARHSPAGTQTHVSSRHTHKVVRVQSGRMCELQKRYSQLLPP